MACVFVSNTTNSLSSLKGLVKKKKSKQCQSLDVLFLSLLKQTMYRVIFRLPPSPLVVEKSAENELELKLKIRVLDPWTTSPPGIPGIENVKVLGIGLHT